MQVRANAGEQEPTWNAANTTRRVVEGRIGLDSVFFHDEIAIGSVSERVSAKRITRGVAWKNRVWIGQKSSDIKRAWSWASRQHNAVAAGMTAWATVG
jgi:hypothetical protein